MENKDYIKSSDFYYDGDEWTYFGASIDEFDFDEDDDGYYFNFIGDDREGVNIKEIKPYLFPLSSMTEEEKKEYYNLCIEEEREEREFGEWITRVYYHNTIESIDWLTKNHFDYRGLIPMGLANDATKLNIY